MPPWPPTSSGNAMPSRPALAADRCSERGISPASSQSWRCGSTSRRTNSAVVACSARRSSRPAHSSSSGMCTSRERSHSPSPLACGSNRVLRGDAVAEQPVDDDVDAAEVGQRVDLDVEVRRLGHQPADAVDGDELAQPLRPLGRWSPARTHRPTLASPPLSPERACTKVPSGTRRVIASSRTPGIGVVCAGSSLGLHPGLLATGGSGTTSVAPSGRCTVCSTVSRSTYAGR